MDSIKLMGGDGGGGGFGQCSLQSSEQLLRRRGLHLFRLLLQDKEKQLSLWFKYVTCFETLEMEMEMESHLVDQVWDTVAEICMGAVVVVSSQKSADPEDLLPPLSWEWISAMLARVLLSDTPVLRKLGLYRFLSGHAGIAIDSNNIVKEQLHPTKKHAKKQNAPLSLVSTDFVLNIIIPSYDMLGQSVGTNVHFQVNGKMQVHDITPLLESFLRPYVQVLDDSGRFEFLRSLLAASILCSIRLKMIVMIFEAVASVDTIDLPVDQDTLQTAVQSLGFLFNGKSIVAVYRERVLGAFALILSRSTTSNAIDPKVLLRVLSLYPIATLTRVNRESIETKLVDNPKYSALQKWLVNLGDSSSWASTVGAACASAFVMGQLFPPMGEWAPESGSTETERLIGGAIVLLCALAAEDTPSSLLWPAIYKGLSTIPSHGWYNANRTCRSIILLESACRLGIVSGMGNGELLVDQKQQMMPPPPNIESLLVSTVNFILQHIEALMSFENNEKREGSARSGNTGRMSSTFALLISQMQVLCYGYPSSLALSSSVNKIFELSMKRLVKEQLNAIDTVTLRWHLGR
jgi:hypothetical protein